MFGQSLLSGAFGGAACTTDTDQLFTSDVTATSTATYQLNSGGTSIPSNTYPLTTRGITYAAGKFGNAAGFSGSNASTGSQLYVSNSIYGGNTSIFSVSLWVKCTNTSGDIPLSGNGGTIGGTAGYALYLESGKLSLTFRSSGESFYGSTTYINDNAWHHIVLTFNNGPFAVYLDGSVSFSGTTGNFLNNTTPSFDTYFGNRWNRNESGVLSGQMDQIRVFGTTVLNQAAVTVLYNETVATSSSASINYQLANPNSIAYYKMSSAADQLGNYNGTATNVNFNTEGKFGFAGAFNGSSSNIEFSAGSFNNTTISVSAWINSASSAADQSIFNSFDYSGSTSKGFIWKKNANNTLTAQFYDNSGTQRNLNTTETITNNVWTNVVLTISTSEAKIYINNGTPVTLTQSNLIAFHSTTRAGIGSFRFTGGSFQQFFNGKIDQIRIYDSVLSAANVSKIYKEIECPEATIVNSFNTVIYTGNGGTQSISTVGFKPDLNWTKIRNLAYSHNLTDTIRGTNSQLRSDSTISQTGAADGITSFDSNGFTVGSAGDWNGSSNTYVAWNWKGGGTAVSNTDGAITSSVSANKEAGFSIVKWTTSTSLATVGHGLGAPAELIIGKGINWSSSWPVYALPVGNDKKSSLNTNAAFSASTIWGITTPTATTFNQDFTGTANRTSIAYCWRSIPGYSRVGSYNGTSASGNVQYLGFQPKWIIIKSTNLNGSYWMMFDNKRVSGSNKLPLYADGAFAEGGGINISFDANGFTLNTTDVNVNGAYEYIFLAIA
jgi:hypothetical protein